MSRDNIRLHSFIFGLLFFGACQSNPSTQQAKLREGDIVFQTSQSAQSQAIQAATHSLYSHMGIIRKEADGIYVAEAVGPVKSTPLQVWIQRGKGGHFVAKRLRNAEGLLNEHGSQKLRAAEKLWYGRPYDLAFGWGDDRIYCSEFVWKVYHKAFGVELGQLRHLREFDLTSPVVQQKLKERYGDAVPMEEPVIAPIDIFNADVLKEVYRQ